MPRLKFTMDAYDIRLFLIMTDTYDVLLILKRTILTLKVLSKIVADDILNFFLIIFIIVLILLSFFRDIKSWHFM